MRIGVDPGYIPAQTIAALGVLCQEYGIGFEETPGPEEALIDNLLSGALDTAVLPLEKVPLPLPVGTAIAALTPDGVRGYGMLCREGTTDPAQTLFIKRAARVNVSSPVVGAQVQWYRPDLLIETVTYPALQMAQWLKGNADIMVLPVAYADACAGNIPPHERIPLHPREVNPPPGQGALAWLVAESAIIQRKLLQPLHHPELAALTNIERKIQRLLLPNKNSLLGVYAEKDRMGYYQVRVFWQKSGSTSPVRTFLSSATSFELPERVVAEIHASS